MQNTITIQILDINTKWIFVPSEMLKWIFPDDQTKKYFQIFCPPCLEIPKCEQMGLLIKIQLSNQSQRLGAGVVKTFSN